MTPETPWPIDPTPGDMAYVAMCSTCHGMVFVCDAEDAISYSRQLMQGIRRGHALHRVPMTLIRNPAWHFCHGHDDLTSRRIT